MEDFCMGVDPARGSVQIALLKTVVDVEE